MRLDKLSRTDMQIGGAALVLAISLLFFPWFSVSVKAFAFSASYSSSGTGAPDGALGVLALLAAIAVIADLGLERYSPQTSIPPLGGSRERTRLILSAVAAALVALKFLIHIHFNYFGWGFYVDVAAAAALVYSALMLTRQGPLA